MEIRHGRRTPAVAGIVLAAVAALWPAALDAQIAPAALRVGWHAFTWGARLGRCRRLSAGQVAQLNRAMRCEAITTSRDEAGVTCRDARGRGVTAFADAATCARQRDDESVAE